MSDRWTLDYAGGLYAHSSALPVSPAHFLVSHSPPKVDVRDPPGFVPALSVKVRCALQTTVEPS
jgi:hypothetical protein